MQHKKEKKRMIFFFNMYAISDVSGGGKRQISFSLFSFLLISISFTLKLSGREYGN